LRIVGHASMTLENIVRDCLTWLAHVWCPGELLHAGAASLSSSRRSSSWSLVTVAAGHADLLLEEAIPAEFVSTLTSTLADSMLSNTNFHLVLRLVAGVFMVADQVYQALKDAPAAQAGTEPLLLALRAALTKYQSVDEEAVRTAVTNRFAPTYPTDSVEARAVGMRLADLVQECCHGLATQPEQGSS